MAKVKAVLRRTEPTSPVVSNEFFESGNLKTHVDFAAAAVFLGEHRISLTPTEYRLLCQLVKSAGKVVPSRTLLGQVWGGTLEESRYLKVHIKHLRNKLGDDPATPKYIFTERNVVTGSSTQLPSPMPIPKAQPPSTDCSKVPLVRSKSPYIPLLGACPIDPSWAGIRGTVVGVGSPIASGSFLRRWENWWACCAPPAFQFQRALDHPQGARPLRHNFSRLWVVPTRAASLESASSPLLLNRRKPCPSFIWPNTGSTSTPRFL